MKFIKIQSGVYKSENGYIIKKYTPNNIFTGKPMSSRETRWHIYDNSNNKIQWTFTLKEAKEYIEKL